MGQAERLRAGEDREPLMLRIVAGLIAAAAAGVWIGTTTEWLSESGGWFETQELHFVAASARGALAFVGAFGVCLAWRGRRLAGWLSPFNVAPFLGAALFVAVDYVPNTVAYYRQFAADLPPGYVARDVLAFAVHVAVFGLFALLIFRVIVTLASWWAPPAPGSV